MYTNGIDQNTVVANDVHPEASGETCKQNGRQQQEMSVIFRSQENSRQHLNILLICDEKGATWKHHYTRNIPWKTAKRGPREKMLGILTQ